MDRHSYNTDITFPCAIVHDSLFSAWHIRQTLTFHLIGLNNLMSRTSIDTSVLNCLNEKSDYKQIN